MFVIFIFISLIVASNSQLRYEDCKRDCTLDWVDCVHGCQSIQNPPQCHQNCQKLVHQCLDDCPLIVCLDKCRVILEECRDMQLSSISCEHQFSSCESECNETYIDDL